ncbi:MAG: hypothetical protein AAB539_00660 [Patescibacteria group bacterium]
MDQEILQKLDTIEKKFDEQMKISRQMRRYFFWTLTISVAVIVFPLIGLIVLVPQFIGIYSTYTNLGL